MTGQSVKEELSEVVALPVLGDAAPIVETRSENAPGEGGAPTEQLPATATAALTAQVIELDALPVYAEDEHEALTLVNYERKTPHEAVRILNERHNTQSWNLDRLADTLRAANAKLLRAGELHLTRPNAHVIEETRGRYDRLVALIQADLDVTPTSAGFLSLRARLIKTMADIERMRDDAMQALAPLPGTLPTGGALIYVSKLRAPQSS